MIRKYATILLISIFFLSNTNAQEMDFYWVKQFGSDNSPNQIQSIASDNMNKIIAFTDFEGEFDIEGIVHSSIGGSDLLIYALNEDGEFEWSIADGGPGNQIAQEVHCDAEGNIYIMGKFNSTMELNGMSFQSNGAFDMFLAKYTTDGSPVWIKTFGGPNSESIETMKIKNNRIYLGGRFYDYTILQNDTIYSEDGTDIFVSKLNLDGEILKTITAGGESVDMVSSIDVDIHGNVFIAGDFYQNIHFEDISFEAGDMLGLYVVKYDANLNLDWAYQIDGDDLKPGLKLSLDSESNITIAGTFSSVINFGNIQLNTADFDEDIFVAHLTYDGWIDWAHRFYSNSMESVLALQVDRFGNTYLTGHYLDHIHFNELIIQYNLCCGDPEIFFVKLNELGEVVDGNQLTGERSQVAAMAVPEVNQVILAGHFSEEVSIGDMILYSPLSYNVFITYYKDDTWLNTDIELNNSDLSLFPSPFNSTFQMTNIQENCKILIYNENGMLVQDLYAQNSVIQLGGIWPAGLYMIQIIQQNGEISNHKVLKL